jgi:hypothetical protein
MTFGPGEHDEVARVCDALVTRFETWAAGSLRPAERDQVTPHDLGLMLDWKYQYADGRLGVWDTSDIDEFLLGWCPRKLSASLEDIRAMPTSIAHAFTFLDSEGLLERGSDPAEVLVKHSVALTAEFVERMSDPANFGLAKSVFGALDIDEPSALSEADLAQAMQAFNALPEDMRREVTGPGLGDLDLDVDLEPEQMPRLGPVRIPPAEQVQESAAAAPVLDAFAKLADYFAPPGRPLTQKGNIRLADARLLVDILQTGESMEEDVGGHTFHRRSSTHVPQLDHWQWWAREAGALRKKGNKLVAVKASQKRRVQDPVGEASKAFDVLSTYGLVSSYYAWYPSDTHDAMDYMLAPILGWLLQADQALEYDDVLGGVQTALTESGISEFYSGETSRVLDRLLTLLERAGVVGQRDVTRTPGPYVGTVRKGGTIALTPFGVTMAVEEVRRAGVTVDVLPPPNAMSAADLAGIAVEAAADPETWWAMVIEWVDSRDDARSAALELVDALADREGLLCFVVAPTPDSHLHLFESVMSELVESEPPPRDVGATALTWLVNNGARDPAQLDPDLIVDAGLGTLGMIAADDPTIVPDMMSDDRDQAAQLDLIAAAAQRMPPRVVALLEAIGQHHTDKVISKAARKELFRVRSRLASQR